MGRSTLIELPMDVTPPTLAEVEASALASPLVASLRRLRDHLGAEGVQLTEQHGIRFTSTHEAIELVGLPILTDPAITGPAITGGSAEPVSCDPRQRLTVLVEVAFECGAIEEIDDRLVPVPGWIDDDPIVLAAVALSTAIDQGILWTSYPRDDALLDIRDAVLDGSCVNWLATLLPAGKEQRVDHFVNWAVDVCREQLIGNPIDDEREFEAWIENGTCLLFDTLAWAGAVEWGSPEVRRATFANAGDAGREVRWFGGGTVRLTALGRHVLPDHLEGAGIRSREPCSDAANAPATTLLGDYFVTEDESTRHALVAQWRPDLSAPERARLVVDAMLESDSPVYRMCGFDVLERIGPAAAEPFVRHLLDSPAADGAAHFLVGHGLATADQMRPFLGFGPLIEILARLANEPERFRTWFMRVMDEAEVPELVIAIIALTPTDEATMVLAAAARHISDPHLAELIRLAERDHRDVLVDRDAAP